jgi:hypothetical protein
MIGPIEVIVTERTFNLSVSAKSESENMNLGYFRSYFFLLIVMVGKKIVVDWL